MAEDQHSAEQRTAAAGALLAVLASAFPGDEFLPRAVRSWIGFDAGEGFGGRDAPQGEGAASPKGEQARKSLCAVCARPHKELAVRPGARLQLARGANAGADAVCGGCLDAAAETFGDPPTEGPSWDMLLAQLERALALVSEEHAALARDCLSKRPRARVDATCLLCRAAKPSAHSGTKGVCEPCTREARRLMGDLAARAEVGNDDTRCPQCGSREIGAGAVGIEFTELTCLSCGHSEICDVWQLDDWKD